MRHTKIFVVSLATVAATLFASSGFCQSIYAGVFDYKKAVSTSVYFQGKSTKEIDHLCSTGEHAGTADIAACSQRDFERVSLELAQLEKTGDAETRINDADLKADGYPIALPYYEKSRKAWLDYRDNLCYGETYSMGLASMRYMSFWDCMTRVTRERINDIKGPHD